MPSRFRVAAGYAVGALTLWLARPTALSLACGVPLVVIGESVRLWASGHIEKTRALATGGPYAHTRNPLYVGSLVMALGAGVASASVWVVAAVAVYFVAFYPAVMREESEFLARKFETEYAAWSAAVPMFVPRLHAGGPRGTRFEWERVRVNREWRTALAVPLVVALLYARGRLFPW